MMKLPRHGANCTAGLPSAPFPRQCTYIHVCNWLSGYTLNPIVARMQGGVNPESCHPVWPQPCFSSMGLSPGLPCLVVTCVWHGLAAGYWTAWYHKATNASRALTQSEARRKRILDYLSRNFKLIIMIIDLVGSQPKPGRKCNYMPKNANIRGFLASR